MGRCLSEEDLHWVDLTSCHDPTVPIIRDGHGVRLISAMQTMNSLKYLPGRLTMTW